jgi:hypothetical protein
MDAPASIAEVEDPPPALQLGPPLLAFIAGDFAQAVARIWPGPRLLDYVTATDGRRHIWHAVLAAGDALDRDIGAGEADDLHQRLTFDKGRVLLARAYGECPTGAVQTLSRLGAAARKPQVYRDLLLTLREGGEAALALRHAKTLKDALIVAARRIGPRRARGLLHAVAAETIFAHEVAPLLWAVDRLAAQGLAPDGLLRIEDPHRTLCNAIPFAAPPWPGSPRFRPITSIGELRAIGAALENCFRDISWHREAVFGDAAHYSWHGREELLLCFKRLPHVGWFLVEFGGRKNKPPAPETLREVADHLAEFDDLCPWSALDDEVFGANRLMGATLHRLLQ